MYDTGYVILFTGLSACRNCVSVGGGKWGEPRVRGISVSLSKPFQSTEDLSQLGDCKYLY